MAYNTNGQMVSQNWSTPSSSLGPTGGLQYSYSATQNNGQITQTTDTLSGETIGYQYDALKRLTSAASTPISGSTPTAWTQNFQYDGFGNLTAKVLNGTSMPIAVNGLTNQLSNANYDLNGNMTSGVGATLTYDSSNRMLSAAEVSGGTEYYGYSPDNKRMYRLTASGTEEWTFYGGYGEKLGVFQYSTSAGLYPVRSNVQFAGRTIVDDNFPVFQDRVGTNRASGARFMPYGDEITSTSNDREKFATYTRDSYTGLDYADQRFYASTYGRFNTPDPYAGSVKPNSPGSWNRYSYTLGDPVNGNDPTGQDGFTLTAGTPPGTMTAIGTGNVCPVGESNVGVISGISCLDDTTILQNSISSFVSGLGDSASSGLGLAGPVYDWGATFSVDGTASADPGPTDGGASTSITDNPFSGGMLSPITSLPDSFFIVPRGLGPIIRVFGQDGSPTVDIDYQPGHPEVGNPHIHNWNNGTRSPVPEPAPPGTPPRPVVPPNAVGPYSPWPREPVPVVQPAPPASTVSPVMTLNPCLFPAMRRYCVSAGPAN
jgi:RHS repeat-associated protein